MAHFGEHFTYTFPVRKGAVFSGTGPMTTSIDGIAYTLHWSKNSGIDEQQLDHMYGADRVSRWRDARKRVFANDASLMRTFENDHLVRAGLAG